MPVFAFSNTPPPFSTPIDGPFRVLGPIGFSLRFTLPKYRRHHEYREIPRKVSFDLHNEPSLQPTSQQARCRILSHALFLLAQLLSRTAAPLEEANDNLDWKNKKLGSETIYLRSKKKK